MHLPAPFRLGVVWISVGSLSGCPDGRRSFADDDTPDDDGADDDVGDDDDTTGDDDAVDDDTTSDDDTGGDDDTSTTDPCDDAISRLTNIGCEFWAVDLDNAENAFDDAAGGQFAVVVANVHDTLTAHVEVVQNDADPGFLPVEALIDAGDVAPGAIHIFRLPRRDVDGDDGLAHSDTGPQTQHSSLAYRIQATAPIVAYQFNTLDQQYSNDASLLLPTHALGTQHLVVAWPPNAPVAFPGSPRNRCYVTVVGVAQNSVVHVTPSADIVDGPGVPAVAPGIGIAAGTEATFNLGPYDVLNLETVLMESLFPPGDIPDVTGTLVGSESPVSVFAGCDLAMVIPDADLGGDVCCAEHLEQQVLPTRAMRNRFVVSRSATRNFAAPEPDVYRIMAAQANTAVTTNLGGADGSFTLNAGEFHQFETTHGFTVDATGPLHVVQFLVVGSSAGYIGDSSLLPVPALEQRRADYTITTGEGFSENWVVISLVEGAGAWFDGTLVDTTWCEGPAIDGEFDGLTYQTWTCPMADGAHRVSSAAEPSEAVEPMGIAVYGYYSAGSYAYPGGAGLD